MLVLHPPPHPPKKNKKREKEKRKNLQPMFKFVCVELFLSPDIMNLFLM
jgi:hypothetical protein